MKSSSTRAADSAVLRRTGQHLLRTGGTNACSITLHVGICTHLGVHPHHVRAHFALTNGGVVGPLRHLEGVCGGVEEGGCFGCVFKKGGALLSTPHITSVFHSTPPVCSPPIYQEFNISHRSCHFCLSLESVRFRNGERDTGERGKG